MEGEGEKAAQCPVPLERQGGVRIRHPETGGVLDRGPFLTRAN